jgi:predicted  nucleic acid-binding Zn-ribbon protein
MTTPVNPSLIAAFKKLKQSLEKIEEKVAQSAIRQRATAAVESARLAASATDAEKRFAMLESELQGLREETTHLQSENADLSRKLHALQQDYLELQHMAGSAVTRLDGSIRQLDMMLEH